jgi:hypothetical protein
MFVQPRPEVPNAMSRDRLARRCAALAVVLGIVFLCAWIVVGWSSDLLFAVAIGAATAVAIFGDGKQRRGSGLLRRRD